MQPPTADAALQQPRHKQVVYQLSSLTPTGCPNMACMCGCLTIRIRSYILRIVLIALLWVAWTLYIAGASKNQQLCNEGMMDASSPWMAKMYGGLQPTSVGDCANFFGLLWWSIWLQFACICAATVTTFGPPARCKRIKGIFTTAMYFFIMSSVLLFLLAAQYNDALYVMLRKVDKPSNNWTVAEYLTTVGAVMSLVTNFSYILWGSYLLPPPLSSGMPNLPPPVDW